MIHKRGYTIVTVRGKDSDDRNQPIGFGLKNIVPTSTVNITGAGKTAKAALYTLRLSTTKVFIYTSLLFKQNRSVMQGGFCFRKKSIFYKIEQILHPNPKPLPEGRGYFLGLPPLDPVGASPLRPHFNIYKRFIDRL